MLLSEKRLKGFRIQALDGELGKVHDFLVGDLSWCVYYMAVDTGVLNLKRKVLVSPLFLDKPDGVEQKLPVQMSRHQLEESPEIDTAMPVSRKRRREMIAWGWLAAVPRGSMVASAAPPPSPAEIEGKLIQSERRDEEQLRSLNELRGYEVEARDGEIGRIEDFILNDGDWLVHYAVINTDKWLQSKKVLLAIDWIDEVQWAGHRIVFNLTKDRIHASPEYDPSQPINREYEHRIYDFHGRPLDEHLAQI